MSAPAEVREDVSSYELLPEAVVALDEAAVPQPEPDVAEPPMPEPRPPPLSVAVPDRRLLNGSAATDRALAAARSAEKSYWVIALIMYAVALCAAFIFGNDRQSDPKAFLIPLQALAIAIPLSFMAYGQRRSAARILADRSRTEYERVSDESSRRQEEARVDAQVLLSARENEGFYFFLAAIVLAVAVIVALAVATSPVQTPWTVGGALAVFNLAVALVSARLRQSDICSRVLAGRRTDPTWPLRPSYAGPIHGASVIFFGIWFMIDVSVSRQVSPLAAVFAAAVVVGGGVFFMWSVVNVARIR